MAQQSISPEIRRNNKNIFTVAGSCIAILLAPITTRDDSDIGEKPCHRGGRDVFRDFQRENKLNLWNKPLAESVRELTYLGWLEPGTLFVQGTDRGLDGLREAFSRRILKPPRNYTIHNLGDVPSIQMNIVQQAQFIPLTEVLCLIISELNKRKINANQEVIRSKLSECYNHITLPSMEIIYKSLTHLLNGGKIRHNGIGYIALDQSVPLDSEFDDYLLNSAFYVNLEQTEKSYLFFKDGQLTKHSLPRSISDKSTQTLNEKQEHNIPKCKSAQIVTAKVNSLKVVKKPVPVKHPATKTATSPVLHSFDDSLVYNTLKPEYARPVLQRSLSMRERKSKSLTHSKFDRTHSMRTNRYAEDDMLLTSDSEYKTSCLGRLLSGKHHSKHQSKQYNKSEVIVQTKQGQSSIGLTKLETFCAQFPPSDIHDPFFNHVHWLKNDIARNSNDISSMCNDSQSMLTMDSFGIPHPPRETKSLPKEATKVNTYRMEAARLSGKAQSLHMKYKEAQQESMPESEAEFLKPTKLYDNKYRTKAVSQQTNTKPTKGNPSTKEDKIKHYFQSLRDSSPIKIQPFQGVDNESFYNDSELDYRHQKENTRGRGTNNRNNIRDRSKDLAKKRQSQKYNSESRTSPLAKSEQLPTPPPSGLMNGDVSDSGSSVYVDKYPHHPHYEVLTSDSDQTLSSHDSEMLIQYKSLTNHKITNQYLPSPSNHFKSVQSIKPVHSSNKPVNSSNQSNSKNISKDCQHSEPIVISRPPIQVPPEPAKKSIEFCSPIQVPPVPAEKSMEFCDTEMNELMSESLNLNEEQSSVQAIKTFSAYPEFTDTKSNSQNTLESGKNNYSISITSCHNQDTIQTHNFLGGHEYSQINVRGLDLKNEVECQKLCMNSNNNIQHIPNRVSHIHNRIESLSSTGDGDSGFNSPRSSVVNNCNHATIVENMSPEHLKVKTSPTKVSSKSESIKLLENSAGVYDRPCSRNPKKYRPKSCIGSDHSSVSDLTVKMTKSKDSKHSDNNSSSSDKSGFSNLRRKQDGKRHHKSYELIGML